MPTNNPAAEAIAKMQDHPEVDDLSQAIETLSALCQRRDWTTDDPLGLGGLLFDACRLCQLLRDENLREILLLEQVMQACRNGLTAFLASRYLDRPTPHRLAFRELGLAIGLRALPIVADTIKRDSSRFASRPLLRRIIELLLPYESLSVTLSEFGCRMHNTRTRVGKLTKTLNEVMLATALIPNMVLSVE
jgi:hypothetical protein